ncbi:MAG: serine/threonine-protein kinase [Candidatus Margulisbacteria bacterium]|nr:serine/threonine-protein kinase [Candidatus Margulisiibacteriota bacterium]
MISLCSKVMEVPSHQIPLPGFNCSRDKKAPIFPTGGVLATRFQIGEKIGSGAMGQVFRAYDAVTDRDVAIKVETGRKKRLPLEAIIYDAFPHQLFPEFHLFGMEQDKLNFIAMELLEGQTLKELKPASMSQIIDITLQICGLESFHNLGWVFLDLKPYNIILQPNGKIKIIDFGIAHRHGQLARKEVGGSPFWMAPEVARLYISDLEKQPTSMISSAADVYSLAIILFELIAGINPIKLAIKKPVVEAHQAIYFHASDTPLAPLEPNHLATKYQLPSYSPKGCLARKNLEKLQVKLNCLLIQMGDKDPTKRINDLGFVHSYLMTQINPLVETLAPYEIHG